MDGSVPKEVDLYAVKMDENDDILAVARKNQPGSVADTLTGINMVLHSVHVATKSNSDFILRVLPLNKSEKKVIKSNSGSDNYSGSNDFDWEEKVRVNAELIEAAEISNRSSKALDIAKGRFTELEKENTCTEADILRANNDELRRTMKQLGYEKVELLNRYVYVTVTGFG
uniref:Uncharacterized protein n=1 Tax=Aplanochytrium stocchinoi TaxID=215587 RepID=A0A7S3PIV7_9STRA|mmetsp:Transcript_15399/g.19058  ORF Transcript_15399/g.19058 Transcript_15399/m.19058 type:complete len:171 (+) Transcript_15399:384-896(+)